MDAVFVSNTSIKKNQKKFASDLHIHERQIMQLLSNSDVGTINNTSKGGIERLLDEESYRGGDAQEDNDMPSPSNNFEGIIYILQINYIISITI